MWMPLGMFGFRNPCCACTVWSGLDLNSYYHWQTLRCSRLTLLFEFILREVLAFLLALPVDYTMSVFRSCLSFLPSTSPILTVQKLERQLPLIWILAMCLSDSSWRLCNNVHCLWEMVVSELLISKLYSFLLTCTWCHCRIFWNTLGLILTSAVFCCLLSYCTSWSIDRHFRLSSCFVR